MRLLIVALFSVLSVYAQASWVQTVQATNGSNVSTLNGSITTTTGNVILVVGIGNQSSAFTFSTPTASGLTFSLLKSAYTGLSGQAGIGIYCASGVSSGSHSVTITTSANTYIQLFLSEVSSASCTLDGSDSYTGLAQSGMTFKAYGTGVVTSNANDVIVSGISNPIGSSTTVSAGGSPGTYTIPTNGSILNGAVNAVGALEYQIVSSATTYLPSFVATSPGAGYNSALVSVAIESSTAPAGNGNFITLMGCCHD